MKQLNFKALFCFLAVLSVVNVWIYWTCRSQLYFHFLNWNLFLAWIPFLLSNWLYAMYLRPTGKGQSVTGAILGLAWLLFLPNSPYVTTDLIHLTVMKNTYVVQGKLGFSYWFDFLIILSFAWTALLLGALSIYQIQYILMKLYNKLISWCFVLTASVAGGYGILLGREYRLNSWEVFTDWTKVMAILKESVTPHSVLFSLLFGLFIGTVYVTMYSLIHSAEPTVLTKASK